MPTLLLRLQGPMQSWGTTSRFDERDTQLEPSKSGVLGLVCAALGRDRSEPVEDLAALRMGVRCDREGAVLRDYQTVGGGRMKLRTANGDVKARTVVSPRFYLSDAAFLVGLEGEDRALLTRAHSALRAPVWPLALGRKSFPPGCPVYLPGGLVEADLLPALRTWPRLAASTAPGPLRFALEDPSEGSVRLDQPTGSFGSRSFGPRFISMVSFDTETLDAPDPAHT